MESINRDIICVDGEFKTVTNEMTNYVDFLIKSIHQYNFQLQQVQMVGIKDELIRAKLMNLATLLSSYADTLDSISEGIGKNSTRFLDDFAQNDKFTFPGEEISAIEVIIRSFG